MKTDDTYAYLIMNPLDGSNEYISNADLETLKQAQSAGMVLIRENSDGMRSFAEPEEIIEWLESNSGFTINVVMQETFVPIMESLLDLMESSMQPAVALLSISGEKKTVNTKFEDFKTKVNDMLELYKPNLEDSETK